MLDIPCIRLLRYFRSSPVPFCKEDTVTLSDAFQTFPVMYLRLIRTKEDGNLFKAVIC